MKINLACGRDYRPGWENIDVSREVKAEHYFDITKSRIPARNNAADEVYCSGFLEQVLTNEELVHVMNEVHRVLAPRGTFTVVVPNAKFSTAHQDPFDVRKFTERTFKYFCQEFQEYKLYGSVYGFLPFLLSSISTNERGIITAVMIKP